MVSPAAPLRPATGLFLYDVTSSYSEGVCNELGALGTNRDGKRGKKQVVAGLLTDEDAWPPWSRAAWPLAGATWT